MPFSSDSKSTAPDGVYVSVDTMLRLRNVARDINLETNKKSVAMMDGDSRTSFRGRGMEFAEVRPYQVGDDIRNIDWRVTARAQKPYTKLFQEERERPVYILVDQRSPMFFGSKREFKSVFAAKLAAIIAWAALQNNDRIGALIFSDHSQTDSRARRGKHAALATIHHLVEFNHRLDSPIVDQAPATHQAERDGDETAPAFNSMEAMLNDIRRIAKPGSSVYIISDFHDFSDECREPLTILARHTDVTAIQLFDELELHLPATRSLTISNDRQKIDINGQSNQFSKNFAASFEEKRKAIRSACNQSAINFASSNISDREAADLARDLFVARGTRKFNTRAKSVAQTAN